MNAHVPAAFLVDRRTRARIEALIERLIAALDAFDGDPDLEDGCDRELDPADMEEDDPAEEDDRAEEFPPATHDLTIAMVVD